MARGATMIFLAASAVMAASLWFPASGQSSCTTALIGLAPCLSYISGNSSSPSSTCCSQLAMIVQSQPQCLCTVLNGGGSSFGISINQTQALALPGACKVQTPPVSQCKGAGGSAAPPSGSPKAPSGPTAPSDPATPSSTPSSPSNTPGTSVAPSGNGSKSTNGDSSDGRRNKSAMDVIFSALIISSCISFLF